MNRFCTSELSGNVMWCQSMPSFSYSSCSRTKINLLKKFWRCSLAALMQSCSKLFCAKSSKPDRSRIPIVLLWLVLKYIKTTDHGLFHTELGKVNTSFLIISSLFLWQKMTIQKVSTYPVQNDLWFITLLLKHDTTFVLHLQFMDYSKQNWVKWILRFLSYPVNFYGRRWQFRK